MYSFVRRIGSGTFGFVVLAENSKKEIVAIKRNFVDHNGPSFLVSLREVELCSRLDHPYIVPTHEILTQPPFDNFPSAMRQRKQRSENLFMIFEAAKGDVTSVKSTFEIKTLTIQLLSALNYLHSLDFIHRDVGPSNILRFHEKNSETPIFKLCDFGISHPWAAADKLSSKAVTWCYRAPEICDGKVYDFKIDIWSLGVTVLELLKGRNFLDRNLGDNNPKILEEIKRLLKDGVASYLSFTPTQIKEFNATSGRFEDFAGLLEGMLQIDASDRITASQALSSKFAASYRMIIPDIQKSSFEMVSRPVPNNPNRKIGLRYLKHLLNNLHRYEWCSVRILFHALRIYDIYLLSLENQPDLFQEFPETGLKKELYFDVCLYISIKYLTDMESPPAFTSIILEDLTGDRYLAMAENLEKLLIKDILQWRIYEPTLYERCSNLSDAKTLLTNILENPEKPLDFFRGPWKGGNFAHFPTVRASPNHLVRVN